MRIIWPTCMQWTFILMFELPIWQESWNQNRREMIKITGMIPMKNTWNYFLHPSLCKCLIIYSPWHIGMLFFTLLSVFLSVVTLLLWIYGYLSVWVSVYAYVYRQFFHFGRHFWLPWSCSAWHTEWISFNGSHSNRHKITQKVHSPPSPCSF